MNSYPSITQLLRLFVCFSGLTLMISTPSPAQSDEVELRVAVLAFRGDDRAINRWSPTMSYLSQQIDGYRFKAIPYKLKALDEIVIDGDVDFVITNAGQFVRLGSKHGLSWLATLKSRRHQGRGPVIGSALVVNANKPFRFLQALKGQRLGAVDPLAFGGFQIYWGEMVNAGYHPEKFFSDILFSSFPVDQLIQWLQSGKVDAAVLPSCVLESMAEEGKLKLNEFRVVDPQHHEGYSCQVSTPLYPNWSFSKLRHTPDWIAEKVAHALLDLPAESSIAKDTGSLGWNAPVSSLGIHQLYQRLNIHPWQEPWWQVARHWLILHWLWGLLIFLLITLGFLHHLWVQILVSRRTHELEKSNEELHHQKQQLEHAQRIAILGELSSDLAHELKQPLAAINSYAEGGAIRIDQKTDEHNIIGVLNRISVQAQRGAKIIERIRVFAKKDEITRQSVDLNNLVIEITNLLDYEFKKHNITPQLHLQKLPLYGYVDPIEIQQLLVNLVRNSLDALQHNDVLPQLTICVEKLHSDDIQIKVEDNGHGLGEIPPETMFKPYFSTKADGLGLGMSICRRIMEAHEGTILIQSAQSRGTLVTCQLTGAYRE